MPAPEFLTPPQLLEDPVVYPLIQPIYFGTPGPYTYNGILYWIAIEFASLHASTSQLVAYSNASPTAAQPGIRIPPVTPFDVLNPMVSWPGTGSIIYVTYTSQSTGEMSMVTFDMNTELWGAPNGTGIISAGGTAINNHFGFMLASGDFQIVYTQQVGANNQVNTIIYSAGVWGAPVQLTTVSSHAILSAVAIGASQIGLWYAENGSGGDIFYAWVSGAAFGGSVNVTPYGSLIGDFGVYSYYDPVSDSAVCAVIQRPSFPSRQLNLLLTSPAASITASVVLVYDDVPNAFQYGTASIAGNAAGDQFYFLATDQADNFLHIFASTSLAAGWAGPTTFYDQAANPTSPAASAPEIAPVYSLFLNGTDYAVTIGQLMNVSGDPPFCGVLVVMIPSAGLGITCDSPPTGTVGVPYTHTFPASSGTPPYTFAITSGALPDGLSLDTATGEVSGTPTLAGTFPFTIEVTDADLNTASVACSITINPTTLSIICDSPPEGAVGVVYSHTFPATGGTPPYTFSIIAGALPNGLTLDTATGVVSGTPTLAGTFGFTVQVEDADLNTASVACSITIAAVLAIVCNNPPAGLVGVAYSHAFLASGGIPPYTFFILTGALPDGLTFDTATGVASGIPTSAGVFNFTARVTDSTAATAVVACSITITNPMPPPPPPPADLVATSLFWCLIAAYITPDQGTT